MNKSQIVVLSCFGCLLSFTSCTIDAYDKGEGEYSQLTAELADAHVGSDKRVDYVDTDQDDRLAVQTPFTLSWVNKPDTTCRIAFFYKMHDDGKAEAVSVGHVGVLQLRDTVAGGLKTDPIYLESAWLGKNRKYLNLRLRLLTGATDDEEAVHRIGLLRDTLGSTPRHLVASLYHDQGGRPEYYSSTAYASIPLSQVSADTLTLHIYTYDGLVTRTFVCR